MRFAIGALATVAEVAATPEAKAKLREATGAVAVDMESALILRAAAEAGCPRLVLRGVSDDAADSLSLELAALITAEGKVRKARAAATVLRHPAILPKARKLQRATQGALAAVAEALQRSVEYRTAVEHEPR
jgi:nucleoside phosphorylase